MEELMETKIGDFPYRSIPDIVQWTNASMVKMGNGTRVVNKTAEQICQASLNKTLLIFPKATFSNSEEICKQHNGMILAGTFEDNVRTYLKENKKAFTEQCNKVIWMEKVNESKSSTDFEKPQGHCRTYDVMLSQMGNSPCENTLCFVCILPLERSIFKVQAKNKEGIKLNSAYTALNNENGSLIYLGTIGDSYFYSRLLISKQNSSWMIVAERNNSGMSLPGVMNLNSVENASTQSAQIKITNVSTKL